MITIHIIPCCRCCCDGIQIQDSFTGTNGTSISGRLPDVEDIGTDWSIVAGTWEINSNKCRKTNVSPGSGVHDKAVIESCQSGETNPITITCDITIPSGTGSKSPGLVFRYADANNFWELTPDVTNHLLYLVALSGGSTVVSMNTAITLTAGSTYSVSVVLNGSSVSGTYNGINLTATNSACLSNTMHGLDDFFDQVGSAGTYPQWDNFKINCT